MSVIQMFAVGTGLALAGAAAVVVVLRPHLARLLEELCGSRARSGFWMVTILLSVFLLALLAGTSDSGYAALEPTPRELFFGLVWQVRAALIGLLAVLLTVAWFLVGAIRRFEQGFSPAPNPSPNRNPWSRPLPAPPPAASQPVAR